MIQRIGHVALRVKDLDRSTRFYTEVLGGDKVFEGTENGQVNVIYIKLADQTYIELFRSDHEHKTETGRTGYIHLCLTVDDIRSTEKDILRTGWPASPVKTGKYGNYQIWIKDPDGNEIELMQILPDFLKQGK